MAQASKMQHTYKVINTKSFKESMSISDAIQNELEPMIKKKITEVRAKIIERKKAKLEKQQTEYGNSYGITGNVWQGG